MSTEIVTMLIEKGLFSELGSLRKQFKEAIEFMCFNIKTGALPQAPYTFFLQKLIGHLEHSQRLSYSRTPDFFDMLKNLLTHYFKVRDREPFSFEAVFDPSSLTKILIGQLEQYKSQESKTSIVADYTLVGIINLIQTLLEANEDVLD